MAPDPGSRTRLISYHGSSEQASAPLSFLLLSTASEVSASLRTDVQALLAAGHRVTWALTALRSPTLPLPGERRLDPAAHVSGVRGRLAFLRARWAGVRRRAALSTQHDPWFGSALTRADLVLAVDRDAAAVLPAAEQLAPHSRRFAPDQTARVVAEQAGWDALARAADDVLAGGRTELGDPTGEGGVVALVQALRRLRDAGLLATAVPREVHWLLAHVARWTPPKLVAEAARAAAALPGVETDDAVLAGYVAAAELDSDAVTRHPVVPLVRRVLTLADEYLAAGDRPMVVRSAGLALDLLFHRELHSDVQRSELVEDPAGYARVLRESAVGDLLTRPVPPTRWRAEPRSPERTSTTSVTAVVLPGPYGSTHRPVVDALTAAPRTSVRVLDLRSVEPTFRTMKMDLVLLRYRLERAQGRPGKGSDAVREGLAGADVVFANWADKGAVLASLEAPAGSRLTVRVHSVDALRPWLHLLDWSRVAHLICVSEHVSDLVRGLLRDRLQHTSCHVVANTIDVERFSSTRPPPEHRTLCLVGWAQRVKDPRWAVEVLAELRADDARWRLLLIGADFADNATVSGRRYAEEFRRRAMADDVREAIEYVGYTDDLPAEVSRAGFALSSSVRESWPVGVMEAAAAGAVPVVRDWPLFATHGSAARMYPADWVVADVEEAVSRIQALTERAVWEPVSARARADVAELSDGVEIDHTLRRIVLGPYAEVADLSDAGRDSDATALVRQELQTAGPVLLRVAINTTRTAGEISLRLALYDRLAEFDDDPRLAERRRRQLGQLRETSARWAPTVAVPVTPVTPVPGRVLHVLKLSMPYRESGYAVRGFYTLRGQHEVGLDVAAVTALDFPAGGPDTGLGDVPPEQQVGGVRHLRLHRDDAPEDEPVDRYLDAYATALAEVAARERPDVIHVHSGHRGYEAALVALSVGRALGRPVVYEVRGFFESLWTRDPTRAEVGESYRRRRETEERCMRAAAAVVTLSDSMRDDIVSRGIDPATVHVVPNAVDGDLFPPRPRSAELSREWGLQGRFVFGYVSNLDHYREGHELLIEAAVALCREGVPATALIVGGGRRAEQLRALADRLDAGDAVVFTDRVPHEQVHDFYALCDVFVIPRVDERAGRLVTPLKPYEAMALGIPLVVSDLPALREVIGEGERGRSFRVGDVESLVAVLRAARDDPAGGAAIAARARAWVLAERSWQVNAQRYREVYASLPRTAPSWPTGLEQAEEDELPGRADHHAAEAGRS